MDIDQTRWYMHHFEADAIETTSIHITVEVIKTLAVIAFGVVIITFTLV